MVLLMEWEVVGFTTYLAVWLTVTLACRLKCPKQDKVSVSPLFAGIRVPIGLKAHHRGGRYIQLLNIVWITLLGFSLIEFYYIVGNVIWLRYIHGTEVAAFVPVIPGLTLSFDLFLDLLPAIFIGVLVHEGFHALTAVLNGLPVKGFGVGLVLGVIPVAFVELEEDELKSSSRFSRLSVFSAGVAGNILVALIIASTFSLLPKAVVIVGVVPGSPAQAAGLEPGSIVKEVNGIDVTSIEDLHAALKGRIRADLTVVYNGKEIHVTLLRANPHDKYGLLLSEAPRPLVEVFGLQLGLRLTSIILLTRMVNEALALINAAPLFITDGAKIVSEFSPRLGLALSVATLLLLGLTMSFQKIG